MPTQAQNEVMENIESSIKFLKGHSGQTKITVGDVLERAGYDRAGSRLYPLIKNLRFNEDDASLLRIRSALLEVAVRVNPLEEWHQDYESGKSGSVSRMLSPPNYSAEAMDPFPEANEAKPFRLMASPETKSAPMFEEHADEHVELEGSHEEIEEEYVPSAKVVQQNIDLRQAKYDLEETALTTVMRAMKNLSVEQRERVFQAAESFYAVGAR